MYKCVSQTYHYLLTTAALIHDDVSDEYQSNQTSN